MGRMERGVEQLFWDEVEMEHLVGGLSAPFAG